MSNIYLFQDEGMEKANIEVFVENWNELNGTLDKFTVIKNPSLEDGVTSNIWLINKAINKDILIELKTNLIEYPDLNICFFLEPKEMNFIETIEELRIEYTFSTISTVVKPTQFSRIDSFLKSVLSKKDMITFDDNWDDIDFDFNQEL